MNHENAVSRLAMMYPTNILNGLFINKTRKPLGPRIEHDFDNELTFLFSLALMNVNT